MALVSKVRRVMPFVTLAVLAVAIYDGWVFYSRHQKTQELQEKREEKEAAADQRVLDVLGGFKILNLYVIPSAVERGKTARFCYSVVGAKTVRVEPNIDGVYPAISHCVEITPKKDTEYTFFAQDDAGHTISQKTSVKVLGR